MRAARLTSNGDFAIETVSDPAPGPGDLVLRVCACGVCGSDLKSRAFMPPGTVMGHEFGGEVVAVGHDAASTWHEGMHAAGLPVFSCGECEECRTGDVAHCTRGAHLVGLGGGDGGFAEYVRVTAAYAVALPTDLPESFTALVEPFAVGLHAVSAAAITAADRVLVLGAGPVGLTVTRWAALHGARDVTIVDPAAPRREMGATFGATAALDPAHDELGGPYDVVIECVGKPGMLDVASQVAATHGRVVIAGVCAEPDPFVPMVALMKELTVRFAVYYRPQEFRAVADAFAAGRIDPSPLVTRTVGLEDLDATFTALSTSPHDAKILVDPRFGSRG